MSSLQDLQTAILRPARQIGPYSSSFALPAGTVQFKPLVAQAFIEETGIDELEKSVHPVERGASVSDNAYKKPVKLILRLGWSNSSLTAAVSDLTALTTLFSGSGQGGFNYVQGIYNQILAIQASLIPITVVTGKRKYSNMLIMSLTQPTNKESEKSLFITMMLEEVIVATTLALTFPDPSVQADPSSTAATQNTGSSQPQVTAFVLKDDGSIGQQVGLH